jgi:hypothetical protein
MVGGVLCVKLMKAAQHAADLQGIVNDIKRSGGAGLFVTRTKPSIPQRLDRSTGSQLDQ